MAPAIDVQLADEQEISSFLATNPVFAVIRAVTYLEFAIRDLAGDLGVRDATTADWLSLAQTLLQRQVLTQQVVKAIAELVRVRNRVAHQPEEPDAREMVVAAEGALALLRALRVTPREVHRAYTIVSVYSNDGATEPYSGVAGLLVYSFDEPGAASTLRIFPYTGWCDMGSRLSFEWDVTKAAGQAWYRNPVTGRSLKAWDRSAIFVGNVLPESDNAARYWMEGALFWAVRTQWTIERFDNADALKAAVGATDVRAEVAAVWSLFHVVDAPNDRMAEAVVGHSVAATLLEVEHVAAGFIDSYVYPSSPPSVEYRP